MNTKSIRFRLTLMYAGLIAAVMLGFGASTYYSVDRYLSLVLTQALRNRARQIGTTFLSDVDKKGEAYLSSEIQVSYAPELNDRFIRVTRSDGYVVYVSGAPNDKSFDPQKVSSATFFQSGEATRNEKTAEGAHMLVTAMPFRAGDKWYLVETGISKAGTDRVLHKLVVTLASGLAVVLFAVIGGSSVLIKRALSPVQKMMRAAHEITIHHPTKRLPVVHSGDEIERLSLALNQMIARLDEAFQATSRFTADASHELRTPLTIMRGELEATLLQAALPGGLRESLGSLLEETERLGKIAEGLSALSRLDAGEAQTERVRLDLAKLAETTAEQMCLLAEEKHIALACETRERVEVEGDRARLKQVIVNLLDNAIKYTPENGKVCLAVKSRNSCALLEIADSGPGVSEAALPHLFERFYRADEARAGEIEGAGLGLSIVHSICAAHGGSVTAANTPPAGCRFSVELPLAGKV